MFFKAVRPLDGKNGATDTYEEKIAGAWAAASIISEPTTEMTIDDYFRMETIMMEWYAADKLQATGYASNLNSTPGADLKQSCNTVDIGFNDRITYI